MNTKNWTDDAIIHALRQGNPERRRAWEHIYKNWRSVWVGTVVKRGGTPDEADEALASIAVPFERAVTAEGFQLKHALRTYLIKCVMREWAKQRKGTPPFDPIDDQDLRNFVESVDKIVIGGELKTAVDALIDTLGERCRRVLRMFGQGDSMEKIAEAEGWKDADKAKKEKYECQTKLKNHLRDNTALANRLKELLYD
jgi:DNA-directed RNA polymerase specialized sigma24 family protein